MAAALLEPKTKPPEVCIADDPSDDYMDAGPKFVVESPPDADDDRRDWPALSAEHIQGGRSESKLGELAEQRSKGSGRRCRNKQSKRR